jgi:hypothetical protein
LTCGAGAPAAARWPKWAGYPHNLPPSTLDLILSLSRKQSVSEFATGWFLPAAGAGGRKPCPSVRRGGTPGRRSHTSKATWALGPVPTVRIGAGAWRHRQACVQAATPAGNAHLTFPGKNTSNPEGKEWLVKGRCKTNLKPVGDNLSHLLRLA